MSEPHDENASEESVVDDTDRDPDYDNNNSNESNLSDTRDEESVIVDFIDLNKWNDISLDRIPKRKSKSEVWNYFGVLKKNNEIFAPWSVVQKNVLPAMFRSAKIKKVYFYDNTRV